MAFWAFLASFIAIFPLNHIIKGKYILQDSNRGKACLLGKIPPAPFAPANDKMILVASLYPIIIIMFVTFQWLKVKFFLKRFCPKGHMACIGAYKRNSLTFNATFYLFLWAVSSSLIMAIVSAASVTFGGWTQYWAWNIPAFFVYECFYFSLPLMLDHLMPPYVIEDINQPRARFYVRQPLFLEPRRPLLHDSKVMIIRPKVIHVGTRQTVALTQESVFFLSPSPSLPTVST